MACSLHIRDITKTYGRDARVLSGVTLDVSAGEICVLVGPSGSGKTTLLRLIAGLEVIDGGTIALNDTDIGNVTPWESMSERVFDRTCSSRAKQFPARRRLPEPDRHVVMRGGKDFAVSAHGNAAVVQLRFCLQLADAPTRRGVPHAGRAND